MKFLNKIDSAGQLIQDADNRLVTDIEKTKWNLVTNKADTNYVNTELNKKETPTGAQTKATKALTDSKAYVDEKVKTDVPVSAKFTDTVYTHPTTAGNKHIPTGGASGQVLKYSTSGTATWQTDEDTITTINGKTGAITKADITALGIPAQDTVYKHPAGTNPHGTTKSDVGLGSVTNVKQMPISGGALENYREKLTTVSAGGGLINLSLGNVFQHTPSGDRSYLITSAVSGQAHSFTLIINMGSTVRTLTFPASVKWQGGEVPNMSTANKIYVLTFVSVNGGTTWLGMFGGEF